MEFIKQFRIAIFIAMLSGAGMIDYFIDNYQVRIQYIPKPTEIAEQKPFRPIQRIRERIETLREDTKELIQVNNWAYYLQNPILKAIKASYFDFLVIDRQSRYNDDKDFTRDQILSLKEFSAGKRKVFAYLSGGMAENYRQYWRQSWNKEKPSWMGDPSKYFKGIFRVENLLHPEWIEITKRQITAIMDAGYDGMVIDYMEFHKEVPSYMKQIYEFAKSRDKNFRIFVQDHINPEIFDYIDGVIKQNLYFNWDETEKSDSNLEVLKLQKLLDEKKNVLVVSYVRDPNKWEEVKKKLQSLKIPGYWAPIELDVLRLKQ